MPVTRRDVLQPLTLALAGCTMSTHGSRIDRLLSRYDGVVPGAAVAIIRDGVATHYLRGFASLEAQERVTSRTNFRLASLTKQFTAAAVLLLMEDGKLTLEDHVRSLLSSLPRATDAITIRHLLTHTSGLIDYEDLIPATLTRQLHDIDVLALLSNEDRLYFKPGSAYRYSNSAYALLSLIVERRSGHSFANFLRSRIFEPLRMDHTTALEEGISTVSLRAFGYTEEHGSWVRTDQSQTSAVLGDGGIYSSLEDLEKWDAALYDERLLKRTTLDLAFAPSTPSDDPQVHYGFGWRITGETLWHSGETIGFRNVIVRYPRRRLTILMLTNRNDPEPYAMALQLAQLYL